MNECPQYSESNFHTFFVYMLVILFFIKVSTHNAKFLGNSLKVEDDFVVVYGENARGRYF